MEQLHIWKSWGGIGHHCPMHPDTSLGADSKTVLLLLYLLGVVASYLSTWDALSCSTPTGSDTSGCFRAGTMGRRSFKSFEDLETDGFKLLCSIYITCKNQHSEDEGAPCYAQKPRSRSYGNPKTPLGRISKWAIHQWEHSIWTCLKSCRCY